MLCDLCSSIGIARQCKSTSTALSSPHHLNLQNLLSAAEEGCELCKAIRDEAALGTAPSLLPSSAPEAAGSDVTDSEAPDRGSPIKYYIDFNGEGEISFEESMFPSSWRVEFGIFTKDVCTLPELQHIKGRPVASSPRDDACFSMIRSWLEMCMTEHGGSCPYSRFYALLTRLVDVGPSDGSHEPVLRCSDPHETGAWLALSHCWGRGPHYMTTTPTLAARKQSINIGELPRTFQDAIFVTRALGYRYIWIDSLCILQDNSSDWASEASRMGSYYRNTTLTIAVDTAAGDDEGFLHTIRQAAEVVATIPSKWGQRHSKSKKKKHKLRSESEVSPNALSNAAFAVVQKYRQYRTSKSKQRINGGFYFILLLGIQVVPRLFVYPVHGRLLSTSEKLKSHLREIDKLE